MQIQLRSSLLVTLLSSALLASCGSTANNTGNDSATGSDAASGAETSTGSDAQPGTDAQPSNTVAVTVKISDGDALAPYRVTVWGQSFGTLNAGQTSTTMNLSQGASREVLIEWGQNFAMNFRSNDDLGQTDNPRATAIVCTISLGGVGCNRP